MATNRPRPMASGTNPPSRNFKVFARRNIPSIAAKQPKSRLARSTLQRQRRTASGIMAREDERSRPCHYGMEGRIEDMQRVGQRVPARQVPEQKGTLPKVVEQEAWIGEPEPAHLDRTPTKVSHIRIHGFPAGDRQHDESED